MEINSKEAAYKELSKLISEAKKLLKEAAELAEKNGFDFSLRLSDAGGETVGIYFDPEMGGWYPSY